MVYYFSWYILILGCALMVFSAVEFLAAKKIFSLWKAWIFHRLFPLHGLVLICGALPLTFFRDTVSGKIMFAMGLIAVMIGPFLILFPEKFRTMFMFTEKELNEDGGAEGIVYLDAVVLGISGIFIIFTILNYGTL